MRCSPDEAALLLYYNHTSSRTRRVSGRRLSHEPLDAPFMESPVLHVQTQSFAATADLTRPRTVCTYQPYRPHRPSEFDCVARPVRSLSPVCDRDRCGQISVRYTTEHSGFFSVL